MIPKKRLFAAAIVFAVSACLSAAAYAADFTLAEARSLAISNSKTLARYKLATDSSVLDEKIQGYESLPSLSLSSSAKASAPASTGKTVLDTVSAGVSVTASQTVWDSGQNAMLAAIDKLSTEIARSEARAEYFSVLDAIDSAWYSMLEARASLEAADASIAASELSLSIAKIKLESGAISMTDYLEAESTVESGKTTRSQAVRDVSIYSSKVASLTGLSTLPSVITEDFSSYDSLITKLAAYTDADTDAFVANIRAAVLAGNSALLKAKLTRDKAGKTVLLTASEYGPTVSAGLSGGVNYAVYGNEISPTVSVSVTGSLPLTVWKSAAEIESSKIAERQASLDLDEELRTVDIDLRTAAYECVAQARSVVSSSKALDYAKRYYENKLESYKLASASVSDVSDAAYLVSSNTKTLISARYDFLSGLSSIRSLATLESDDDVRNLIP